MNCKTVKEYAQEKRVTERTVYNWIRRNPKKHNAEKIEGVWRIYFKAHQN